MVKIILKGHSYFNASLAKKDIYSIDGKDKYHARILVDVESEICGTQMQFVSYDSKSVDWTKDELLIAFNKVYLHIKLFVDTDGPIKIFEENLFHLETEKLQSDELMNDFRIEIPEDIGNIKKINNGLLQINEAQFNFEKCKDKLSEVISSWPGHLNRYYYNIISIIDYLNDVVNAGVVTYSNKENLKHIRSAFDELRKRKKTRNDTYQTVLNMAQREIYSLEFPKYFKATLPQKEISLVLEEIF